MKYFPSHDALSLLEVRTESYFLGCSVAHSFVQKVLLQLKEIGHSLVYTFQLQGSKDFDREKKQSHLFSNSISNGDCLSEYVISKQPSCSLFILLLLARL